MSRKNWIYKFGQSGVVNRWQKVKPVVKYLEYNMNNI